MIKKWLFLPLGILLCGSLLWLQSSPRLGAEENLNEQVTKILSNQEKILQDLVDIKKELARIRIRAN